MGIEQPPIQPMEAHAVDQGNPPVVEPERVARVPKKGSGKHLAKSLKVLVAAAGLFAGSEIYARNADEPTINNQGTENVKPEEVQKKLLGLCQQLMDVLPIKEPMESPDDGKSYYSNFGAFSVEVYENTYQKGNAKGHLDNSERFSVEYKNGTNEIIIDKSFGGKVRGIQINKAESFPGAQKMTYEQCERLSEEVGITRIIFTGVEQRTGKPKTEATLWVKVLNDDEVEEYIRKGIGEAEVTKSK